MRPEIKREQYVIASWDNLPELPRWYNLAGSCQTQDQALNRAKQLSFDNPGVTFGIFKAIAVCHAEKPQPLLPIPELEMYP